MPPALFDIDTSAAPYVVRNAVTGQVFTTSADIAHCEQWCNDNPSERYLVIERRDSWLSFDEYIARGMLRNYPGERKRKPADMQLGMFG